MQHSSMQLAPIQTSTALGYAVDATDIPSPGKPFASSIMLVESTRVAGTTHVADIDQLVEELAEGTELELVREPHNPWDRWATLVLDAKRRKLGYVPCDINEIPARLMDGGKRVFGKVIDVEKRGSWNRINMEVLLDD